MTILKRTFLEPPPRDLRFPGTMNLSTAQSLLRPAMSPSAGQQWYDLGAGTGPFTRALAELLPGGSIVAVDKNVLSMVSIPDRIGSVTIDKVESDFTRISFGRRVDGILMANALHFVKDKVAFLRSLKAGLKEQGMLLIVEYEMDRGTPWVPYPLNFDSLKTLSIDIGFSVVTKLATAPSQFHTGGMYSASVRL
jgi:ubiquinone/menaquinone biosynthesis C-methylase UbiE